MYRGDDNLKENGEIFLDCIGIEYASLYGVFSGPLPELRWGLAG